MTLSWEAVVRNLLTGEYVTYDIEAKDCLGAEGEALRLAAKQWPTDDGSASPLEVDQLRLVGKFILIKGGTLDAGGLTEDQAERINEEFCGPCEYGSDWFYDS